MTTIDRNLRPAEVYVEFPGSDEDEHLVVVLSREEFNRGKYALCAPLTSRKFRQRALMPNCVPLHAGKHGLRRNCVVKTERTTVYEKEFLDIAGGPVTTLDPSTMRAIKTALGYVIEAEFESE